MHLNADKGYFNGPENLACFGADITTSVARLATGNAAKETYVKADFAYDSEHDVYICPVGYDHCCR